MDVWWYGYSDGMGLPLLLLVYPLGVGIVYFVGWLILREKKK